MYPKDRVILKNVTLYVGNTPVFWFPYLYQPLRKDMSYVIRPGYYSQWGAFLLTSVNFPITDDWKGQLHLDLREHSRRGRRAGFRLPLRRG